MLRVACCVLRGETATSCYVNGATRNTQHAAGDRWLMKTSCTGEKERDVFLELRQISKYFPARDGSGEVRAVDDVNIDIRQGQFVTLLGPSGCGKTTTLRLIAGFEFPTHGDILLDGKAVNELPPNRRDMAMVFQSYAIFPHLNVFENIAYGLKIKKLSGQEIKRKVSQVLTLTELHGLENRAPNQLSGGQQQRVALARALVMEPKVLLFDEPLSNLDAKLRVQMRSEIRRIQQDLGITSVYVTHDQDEAMVLSDLIVIMHKGRIQQSDTALEIYRRPHNRFVADFIGRANFLPVEIEERTAAGWALRFQGFSESAPAAADATLGSRATGTAHGPARIDPVDGKRAGRSAGAHGAVGAHLVSGQPGGI